MPCLLLPRLLRVRTDDSGQDGRGGLQAHFLGLGRAGENLNGHTDNCVHLRLFTPYLLHFCHKCI